MKLILKKNWFVIFSIITPIFLYAIYHSVFFNSINPMITTEYSFSYNYGFISRAFMGTILFIIDNIIPQNMYTISNLYIFINITVFIFLFFLIIFSNIIFQKTPSCLRIKTSYLIMLLYIFVIPIFSTTTDFGRLDMLLITISIINSLCIISDRCLWAIPILSVIACCIHEGYVFTYANITLVLLLFMVIERNPNGSKGLKHLFSLLQDKYMILFMLTLSVDSLLFLYFQFFMYTPTTKQTQAIIQTARSFSSDGSSYFPNIVMQNIQRINITASELANNPFQFQRLLTFIILSLPLSVPFMNLLITILKKSNKIQKVKYCLLFSGPLTLIPEFILKVDFGRWILSIIVYYCITILSLLAIHDSLLCSTLSSFGSKTFVSTRQKVFFFLLLLGYSFLFQPLSAFLIDNLIISLCPNFIF